ncbi:hypothetical protein G7K_1699-t1 [Saitoella complicata NRRL Y-17804]|uniref:Uncharacterized protein n=1 Tax=Saitoella complicata (strain BCRC 22490 / CBS 7301 / JCM 7358 / NBRC 10748 / NRRL Y-17804) TaxID=698492 RepID=A0A0E9NCG9_SAICN|nr:hypothetical protein G7K_1699-t1 [Saitoella complicata NRRL Y-17804]
MLVEEKGYILLWSFSDRQVLRALTPASREIIRHRACLPPKHHSTTRITMSTAYIRAHTGEFLVEKDNAIIPSKQTGSHAAEEGQRSKFVISDGDLLKTDDGKEATASIEGKTYKIKVKKHTPTAFSLEALDESGKETGQFLSLKIGALTLHDKFEVLEAFTVVDE